MLNKISTLILPILILTILTWGILKKQPVYAGASGPVCAPLVTYSYIFDEMRKGKYKRILLAATGALMSPTMVNHKLTIPGVCHAVSLEVIL